MFQQNKNKNSQVTRRCCLRMFIFTNMASQLIIQCLIRHWFIIKDNPISHYFLEHPSRRVYISYPKNNFVFAYLLRIQTLEFTVSLDQSQFICRSEARFTSKSHRIKRFLYYTIKSVFFFTDQFILLLSTSQFSRDSKVSFQH